MTLTIREKTQKLVLTPPFILSVTFLSFVLSALTGGIGYFIGIFAILLTLWATKWKWSIFGLMRNSFPKTILKALFFTLLIIVANDVFLQPLIEKIFGFTDLSALEGIKGNFVNYLIFIAIMWITAAFGEELLYRGYITKQLANIFGNSLGAWAIAIIISSVIFGFAHLYQGASGVITTGFIAVVFGAIFYRNQNNLWVGILTHGIYDVFGITLIFLDKERLISEWVQQNIYFFVN